MDETTSLAPHGVGGLKSAFSVLVMVYPLSHPTRGGWIEMSSIPSLIFAVLSHPTRGGWIEIQA